MNPSELGAVALTIHRVLVIDGGWRGTGSRAVPTVDLAALASSARQLNDEHLLNFCRRIQARAIRRAGEVLDEIEPAGGTRTDLEPSDGTDTRLTRKQAARQAGLSDRQRVTALRVSAVPTAQFDSLVESETPPTITKLAELGTTETKPAAPPIIEPDHLNGRDPADFQVATRLWGGIREFARRVGEIDLDAASRGLSEHEAWPVRMAVGEIRNGWRGSISQLEAAMAYSPGDLNTEVLAVIAQQSAQGDIVSRAWVVTAILTAHPLKRHSKKDPDDF